MYFVFMFGGCSMFISLHLDAYLLQIADRCRILKRLPFPNRSSDSYDLYIVFERFHPLYPVAHLVFQVDARFMIFLSYLAFCIPHRIPHSISSFHHIARSCPSLIVSLLLVCLVGYSRETSSLPRSPLSSLVRIQPTLTTVQAR